MVVAKLAMESEAQLEEERRLCYVGVTRAGERLYLLRAFRRGLMGNSGPTLASRFLRDLPPELVGSARTSTKPTAMPTTGNSNPLA